jgi:hypothetical protein
VSREYAVTVIDLMSAAEADVARFTAPTPDPAWDIRGALGGKPGTGQVIVLWQRDVQEPRTPKPPTPMFKVAHGAHG